MSMRIEPPGLPPPLVDERASADGYPVVESTWDTLARAAIMLTSLHSDSRVRVKWTRWSLVFWCCWRPMRVGHCEYQPKALTFGWRREFGGFRACGRCGRITRTV